MYNLSTVNLESLLNWLESLLAGLGNWGTNDQLGLQLPGLWNAPDALDLGIDQWVVVLEVGTETLGLEGSPDGVLVHAVGLGSPDWESVGVDGELVLEFLDGSSVIEEEDLGPVLAGVRGKLH
jgi:hypothetical protein